MNRFDAHIQYALESVTLLNLVAKGTPYIERYLRDAAKKNNITISPRSEEVVRLLACIENEAFTAFSEEMETVRFYFQNVNDSMKSFGNVLLLTTDIVFPPHWKTVKNLEKYLSDMSEEQYLKDFCVEVSRYAGDMNPEDDDEKEFSYVDVFETIALMEESDSEKIRLQELFLHHREHLEKVLPLLKKAEGILKTYAKQLEAFGKQTVSYVQEELGESSFVSFMLNRLQNKEGSLGENRPCDVWINYFCPITIGVRLEGKTIEEAEGLGCVGVIYDASIPFAMVLEGRSKMEDDKAQRILKLLADKSKFYILTQTAKKEAYGAQLAAELGLSTATISHHTSALMDENLLNIEKVDTKIYYRANKDLIKSLLEYLEDKLL